ncbi:GLIPR1-like protein 1 [Genypterus blacodes]|uniref:GLIPR1-like protein 1 n=1 Tax=Genypterus blacodes TaxID=154954 RepID=UPI003F758407
MFHFITSSMLLFVEVLSSMWLILQCGVYAVSLPEVTDGKFIEDCVKAHNWARSSVEPRASDMLQMTWDEGLAVTARDWARNCVFKHSTAGENLWVGYPPSYFTVKGAIENWVKEKGDYDYKSNDCSNICGHYTQVVWASSYKVGCAVQLCPKGVKETDFGNRESAIFVCHYVPAGNINRRRPYKTGGISCSACEGVCVESLCRDTRTPESAPARASCGPSCVAVVAVRPLALICTFLAAYAVQRLYPDIYCYE